MAPLLGRKPFPLAKPLPPGEAGERFIVPHTQEAFRTREYPPSLWGLREGAGAGRERRFRVGRGRAGSVRLLTPVPGGGWLSGRCPG